MTFFLRNLTALALAGMMSGCALPQFPWMPHDARTPREKAAEDKKPKAGETAVKRIIREISVSPEADETAVSILADGPFEYISYKLEDPSRLVVEISNAVSKLSSPDLIEVKEGIINIIRVISFERANVVRVEMGLRKNASYETSLKEGALTVMVRKVEDPALAEAHERLSRAKKKMAEQSGQISALRNRVEDLESMREEDTRKIAKLEARLELLQKAPVPAAGSVPEMKSEEAPQDETSAVPAEEEEREGVIRAVRLWAEAWQSKDIGRYARCYGEAFENDGEALDAWIDSKRNKFLQAGDIEIIIEGIEVAFDEGGAVATFTQRYNSENHSDTGVKTLVMSKTADGWKIVKESWSPQQ